MSCPLPGMHPYRESQWSGVHARPIASAADDLGPQLADDLSADIEEQVHIDRYDDTRWPAGRPWLSQSCSSRPARSTVSHADPTGGPVGLSPTRLAERLLTVRVLLRPGELDVPLDLQALVDKVYRNGRHDEIDYAGLRDPPWAGPEADWADAVLRGPGRR